MFHVYYCYYYCWTQGLRHPGKHLPLSCSSAPILYFALWSRILLKSSRLALTTAWSSCLCFLWIWDDKPIPPGLPRDFWGFFFLKNMFCELSCLVFSFPHRELFIIRDPPEALCWVSDTFCVGHSLCKCFHRLYILVFESSPISLPPTEHWQWLLVSQMSLDPKRLFRACFLHSLFILLFPFLIILTTESPLRSSFSFHLIHFNICLSTAPLSL